jgi:hypothetical protein
LECRDPAVFPDAFHPFAGLARRLVALLLCPRDLDCILTTPNLSWAKETVAPLKNISPRISAAAPRMILGMHDSGFIFGYLGGM